MSDDTFTVKGFTSWKKAQEKKKGFLKHEESSGHRDAVQAYQKFLTEKPVDQQVDEHHDQEVSARARAVARNRLVVGQLFSIARFLAKMSLPFRGRREGPKSQNKGLFRELVQFVANSGNELLKDHLLSAPKNATYLGKDAQNEMITILGSAGRDEVVTRVRKAQKSMWS